MVPICAGRLPSIESELAIDDRSCITVERLSAPAPGLPLAPRLGINAPALALPPKPQLPELPAAPGVARRDGVDGSTCAGGVGQTEALKTGMRAETAPGRGSAVIGGGHRPLCLPGVRWRRRRLPGLLEPLRSRRPDDDASRASDARSAA